MSEPISLMFPLHKADAARRLVFGKIDEAPDRAGEVFDYESSKPYFESWSAAQKRASNGRSFGNVRAMHGKVAAGVLDGIHFDDQAKAVELVARIIDDEEWKKVEEGVYTGFSPGGRYVKRWAADGGLMRYTAAPSEVSLVDLPCIPSATFTLVKADGMIVEQVFRRGNEMAALLKEGRRNSAADLDHLQHIHDTAVALGASCPEQRPDQDLDPAALAAGADKAMMGGTLHKLAQEIAVLREDYVKLAADRNGLARRVLELESQPRPGGPVLRTVAKSQDGAFDGPEDELGRIRALPDGLEKSLALIKLSHRRPMVMGY